MSATEFADKLKPNCTTLGELLAWADLQNIPMDTPLMVYCAGEGETDVGAAKLGDTIVYECQLDVIAFVIEPIQ